MFYVWKQMIWIEKILNI